MSLVTNNYMTLDTILDCLSVAFPTKRALRVSSIV